MAIETKKGQLKEPFTISGSGKQVRDVLHAEDMKILYFSALSSSQATGGTVLNIGGGAANSLSLLELFSMLEGILNINLSYSRLPARESDQKVFVADIKKAKKLLNWQPKISTEEGLHKMIKWLLEVA
jgi:CDP-paratose 2-epimerase